LPSINLARARFIYHSLCEGPIPASNSARSYIVPRLLIAASLLTAASIATPATAQDATTPQNAASSAAADQPSGNERINQLIVYGDDPCPESTGDEITVCARKDESERYRIPEPLRESTSPQNEAWNNRVLAYETVTKTGTLSCSAVGPGGMTGCLSNMIDKAYAERRTDPNIRFSQLIAEERARRLSTIDADAAETQARVEQLEKEHDAKQRAQQDPNGEAPAPAGQQQTGQAPAAPLTTPPAGN
jgi:hypothetical protein